MNVIRTRAAYDSSTEDLKKLPDKCDALKRDEIMAAVVKNKKSYDKILNFPADEG